MSVIWDKYLPQRQKMYLGLVRPGKKSDQSEHLQSDQSLCQAYFG